jgi:tetratricopeptide (TPR) repeat protein
MSKGSDDETRREAFRLFEEGKYAESLERCRAAKKTAPDQQLAILAAQNLFSLGHYEEAEAYVQDLSREMPDSSYLSSFLGRIREAQGDDTAAALYARAVVLDPANQEALRWYAAYLVSRGDHRMAVPVLKKLTVVSGKEEDARSLVRSLVASGQAREALAVFRKELRKRDDDQDYLSALIGSGRYHEAAREAALAYRKTTKRVFAQIHLRALALKNAEAALPEYKEYFEALKDARIGYDYAVLLSSFKRSQEALQVCREVLDSGIDGHDYPVRLLICRLNAELGEKERATGCFEHLIAESLQKLDDPGFLSELLSSYREFLLTYYPVRDSVPRFLTLISAHPQVICLLATARLYEDIGDLSEARSYFYRAFRSDFFQGGLDYSRFLIRQNDMRESEKILLYILNNARKTRDIETVAGVILDEKWKLYRRKRLLERLVILLEERITSLGSEGLEYLAVAYLVSAGTARREHDYLRCKECCLKGLDAVPLVSAHIRPEDFLELLRTCKEEALCDLPVMEHRHRPAEPSSERSSVVQQFLETCDDQERHIIEYLRDHHEATELELRRLLNTRRVVGIVNRIIQKAASSGIQILEKRGVGEGGEIYCYVAAG